jgi:hypothetical protein
VEGSNKAFPPQKTGCDEIATRFLWWIISLLTNRKFSGILQIHTEIFSEKFHQERPPVFRK